MKRIDRTSFEVISMFFSPIKEYKKITLKAIIPWVLSSFISIYLVYLLKDITNLLQVWKYDEVMSYVIIFIVLWSVNLATIIITRNWTHAVLRPVYRMYMYKKYIKEYVSLDNNETEKLGTWKLIAMIDKWMHSWVDLLVRFILDVLPIITLIIFSFFVVWLININYILLVIISFVIILYLTYILQKRAKVLRLYRRDLNINITSKFVKVLMSKFEVLQNDKIIEEWEGIANELYKNIEVNKKIWNYNAPIDFFLRLLIDWLKVIVVLALWFWFFGQEINLWEFVSLIWIIYILDNILSRSLSMYVDFWKVFVDVEKMWDFFDATPKIVWYGKWKDFIYNKWDIRLENITYWYSDESKVFKDFDLDIEWWKVTALVWNSWWWKSTLVKLISWYIRQDSWYIIIDWQKLGDVSLKSYYNHIWYLTQEPSVFDWSIIENLTYAVDREVTIEEIDEILKLSECDFVKDLVAWVNTQIWERWLRLSWGQKQRLAIAKIFLKDPKIIILDEPTSALDSFSEEKIIKAMNNLFIWRTVIVIAHRLQTVKHADDIIFIDNWSILERWKHSELVKMKWRYKKMLDLQSGF